MSQQRRQALVTGGTRGIGGATAKAFVEAGYEVFVHGTASDGQGPEGCKYLPCDFSDFEVLQSFATEVAKLDLAVLVNNAGINKVGLLPDYDPADFARLQQVNVTAPFLLCRAVVPGMRERRFGRIVNITSVLSVISKVGRSAYSASKFGLFGLSRALALEVAADNILVNCVAPGVVDTDLTRNVLGESGIAALLPRIPLGRLARPAEIARYVLFLASEENSYMTGQNIVIDGGFTSG
jgi:3-oxoacyl-[acyl-carrier protein] reductase